jgi:hypothetical protein
MNVRGNFCVKSIAAHSIRGGAAPVEGPVRPDRSRLTREKAL